MVRALSRCGGGAALLTAALIWAATLGFVGAFGREDLFRPTFEIAAPLLMILVLLATKAHFNARGYRAADRTILLLIPVIALSIVLNQINGGFLSYGTPGSLPVTSYLAVANYVLWFAVAIPFGIGLLGFRRLGGVIWTVTAIFYFVTAAVFLVAWAALGIGVAADALDSSLSLGYGAVLGLYLMLLGAVFVLPPTMICHAVALFLGRSRTPALATT